MRKPTHTYSDPLDIIWIHAAEQMGMKIARSSDVFASWDGATLCIGTPETLDPDDSLAQMVLHETCHALIEGPESFHKADWGLDITDAAQKVREHSCLRLQAALTEPYGLRTFLAATTNFRTYYDKLPADPLADDSDPAIPAAQQAMHRAQTGPWAETLANALERTRQLATIVSPLVNDQSIWSLSAE